MDPMVPRVSLLVMKITSLSRRPQRTTRRVTHTRSYGPLLRIADCIAGRQDRRQTGTSTDSDGATIVTPYARRLQATFDENDRAAFARLQDTCQQPATKLRELLTDLERLTSQINEAQSRLNQLPTAPSTEELAARNGGELHLDTHAVATRRRREHNSRLERAQADIAKLLQARNRHRIECAQHAARLTEEFEMGRSISERLRQYYNRRLAAYARHARIPGPAIPVIDTPRWTTQPCPWIPANHTQTLAAQPNLIGAAPT